jgi:hypothetical protein
MDRASEHDPMCLPASGGDFQPKHRAVIGRMERKQFDLLPGECLL